MSLVNIITLILGIIGTILGIVNFVYILDKGRVKIKVFPKILVFLENHAESPVTRFCIEVINLSEFPVTIREVGFVLKKPWRAKIFSSRSRIVAGGQLPKRLESRSSITVYVDNSTMMDYVKKVNSAYAITECGEEFKGKNRFLRTKFNKSPDINTNQK